ncbi:MAG: YdaS family helix-turn-helix protein [Acidovorax sp.]|nr:YdaS family helix-turn-helix protein [Acidovorax sp.]MDH4425088.1 YdaS family helix-turn-helix protein [Acidovorax sp.]
MSNTPHPIDRAAALLGGRAAMAQRLGVTPAALGNWKVRGVPIEHCPAIERLTDRAVNRPALRPDDWQQIWPELAASQPTGAGQEVANA